jgi:hypothetical protein
MFILCALFICKYIFYRASADKWAQILNGLEKNDRDINHNASEKDDSGIRMDQEKFADHQTKNKYLYI